MSNNKKTTKTHKQGQSKKSEESSGDEYALVLAESLISQANENNNSESNTTKLCDTVRKLGGILITYEPDLQTIQSSQKTKPTNNTSIKQSTVCFSVSKIGDLLRANPSKEVQLEVIQLVKSLASKESLNFLLRQLGLMNELNPYLNSTDGNIINEAAQAIDALKRTAEDSVQKFGFGYRKEDGTFSTVAVITQDNYHNVGMAWKIWDAAIYLTQWIYDNSDLFVGKKVLELGAGCGLSGIIAAMFADSVVLTDYLPQIDKFLKENIKANSKLTRNLPTTAIIDWTSDSIVQHPILKKGVDVIIGADIFFQPQLAHHLAKCVNMYLGNKGVFYGCSGSRRQGVQQFMAGMKELGYQVETQLPGNLENIHPDDDEMFFFYCYKKE